MWARDDRHLGVFKDQSGRQVGKNDDNEVLTIVPGAESDGGMVWRPVVP